MKEEDLMFPVTAEAFIAYQAAGIGRELTANEREVADAWVPIINDYYQDGKIGDHESLISGCDKMDGFIAEKGKDNESVGKFLRSMRWWIIYAWDQGSKSREVAV